MKLLTEKQKEEVALFYRRHGQDLDNFDHQQRRRDYKFNEYHTRVVFEDYDEDEDEEGDRLKLISPQSTNIDFDGQVIDNSPQSNWESINFHVGRAKRTKEEEKEQTKSIPTFDGGYAADGSGGQETPLDLQPGGDE